MVQAMGPCVGMAVEPVTMSSRPKAALAESEFKRQ